MKAAILGAGFIAEFHALGYEAIEDVELCAVCDTDAQKAQALAERFHCAWYTDAGELLQKERPELVSVCLPTFLHREYVVTALEAGAHVLCEKPFSLTMEDAHAMRDAAQQTGRMLMVAQVLRWWPEYTVIAQNIRRLGRPLYMQARRFQHPSRQSWHMEEKLGGGALFDLFVHDMDYVLSLLGTDAQVVSVSGSRGGGGSWRRVTASLQWPSGESAVVEASSQMPEGYPFTAAFHAQYADAALDYRFRTAVNIERGAKAETEFLLYENGGVSALEPSQNAQEKAFKAQLAAFVDGVKTGISPLPVEETVAVMQVIHRVKAMLEEQEQEQFTSSH